MQEVMAFDIGARRMAMAHILVEPIKLTSRQKPVFDVVPPFKIISLKFGDLHIDYSTPLADRIKAIAEFVDDIKGVSSPAIIAIERQFVAPLKPGSIVDEHRHENRLAESIMYMLMGYMKAKFPGSDVRIVTPMLAKKRQDKDKAQHEKKMELTRMGLDILRQNSEEWLEYTMSQKVQTDICESLMLGLYTGASV